MRRNRAKRVLDDSTLELVRHYFEACPNQTLKQLCGRLHLDHGKEASQATVWRGLRRLGLRKSRLNETTVGLLRSWVTETPRPTLKELCTRLQAECGLPIRHVSTMSKLLKKLRLSKPRLEGSRLKLVQRLSNENPYATLKELCQHLHEECGLRVSPPTMSLALRKLGLKKSTSQGTETKFDLLYHLASEGSYRSYNNYKRENSREGIPIEFENFDEDRERRSNAFGQSNS